MQRADLCRYEQPLARSAPVYGSLVGGDFERGRYAAKELSSVPKFSDSREAYCKKIDMTPCS